MSEPGGLRERLADGGSVFGTMLVGFDTPGIPRIAAGAGAEFLLIDLEHTGWGIDAIRPLLQASNAVGVPSIARAQGSLRHLLSPVLDAGASGVMVPMVDDGAEARRVVDATRFAPHGSRGFGLLYPDQLAPGVAEAMARADRATVVIVQIETAAGVEHVDDIARTPGVDCLWVGQFDLSIAMGIPGAFDDPALRAAEDRVLAACADAGVAAGILVASAEVARSMGASGFRMIAVGTDIGLYGGALREAIRQGRNGEASPS